MYSMRCRGEYFEIGSKGEISKEGVRPSGDWMLYAIVPKWNIKPYEQFQWPYIKDQLDQGFQVEGYVYDIDHGTLRFWGGRYHGKLPKAVLVKYN